MKRAAIWAVSNAALVLALWLGYHDGVSGARNVAAFIVWFGFVLSLFAGAESVRKAMQEKGPPVPPLLDGTLETAIVLFLAWYGHPWMALAYAYHAIALHGAYKREAV